MYFIGAYKRFSNPTKRVKNTSRSTKHEVAYYFDESLSFKCKKISKWQYYLYKWFKKPYKKKKYYCELCEKQFFSLVQNEKESVECPYCLE